MRERRRRCLNADQRKGCRLRSGAGNEERLQGQGRTSTSFDAFSWLLFAPAQTFEVQVAEPLHDLTFFLNSAARSLRTDTRTVRAVYNTVKTADQQVAERHTSLSIR